MTTKQSTAPLSVLILCTGNSARSQMAEALMNQKSQGRVVAQSAGSHPAPRVNPFAISALREIGIEWAGHAPRSVDDFARDRWDFVVTVCDNAKESCPILPGQPAQLHWGMKDPADVDGDDAEKVTAFREAREVLSTRIDDWLSQLPAPAQAIKFNE